MAFDGGTQHNNIIVYLVSIARIRCGFDTSFFFRLAAAKSNYVQCKDNTFPSRFFFVSSDAVKSNFKRYTAKGRLKIFRHIVLIVGIYVVSREHKKYYVDIIS